MSAKKAWRIVHRSPCPSDRNLAAPWLADSHCSAAMAMVTSGKTMVKS
ncbi:hypothetical protein IMZ48_25610, partial [Candidatus Bathyarchaeota archaeon]|nr:hypothetical protein [Candidatus Bathyarchaeota archaeon]